MPSGSQAVEALSTGRSKTQYFLASVIDAIPGAGVSIALAAASVFVSRVVGGPVMLYALVFGMMCHPFVKAPTYQSGLQFSAKKILRIGVGLLGVKIALVDIANLGFQTAALVAICVSGTILTGILVGRLLGLKTDHAILSSGAVAICGASAALALSSVLPETKTSERNTCVAVIGVTALSTIAMVLYPAITMMFNFSDMQSGVFLGATIHDVAQVVGAGYMVSDPAGDIATIVKLMRVACLIPVIAILSLIYGGRRATDVTSSGRNLEPNVKARPPLVPLFLIGFVVLMLANSAGLFSAEVKSGLSALSKFALVTAIAALGGRTSLRELLQVERSAGFILLVQTALLAFFVLGVVAGLEIFG